MAFVPVVFWDWDWRSRAWWPATELSPLSDWTLPAGVL
jgi:hypothetical protein